MARMSRAWSVVSGWQSQESVLTEARSSGSRFPTNTRAAVADLAVLQIRAAAPIEKQRHGRRLRLVGERDDVPGLTVVENREIGGLQAADQMPIVIEHGRVDRDHLGRRPERRRRLLRKERPGRQCQTGGGRTGRPRHLTFTITDPVRSDFGS